MISSTTCLLPPSARLLLKAHRSYRRLYYTNADRVKADDPYAILGLQWGDGATLSEIKSAYRIQAAKLHPDVNPAPSAAREFQKLKRAYEQLTKAHDNRSSIEGTEEWRASLWRNGDRIAVNRNDVAGVRRMRPIPPVSVNVNSYEIGNANTTTSSDYIGTSNGKTSSSVGTGKNKWVKPVAYKPWKRSDR